MRTLFGLLLILGFACAAGTADSPAPKASDANPFFSKWNTPFGVPPFESIKLEHYQPALEEGMRRQQAEIAAIVASTDAPAFANTIEALDRTGELLVATNNVFQNQLSASTSEPLQKIAQDIAPATSRHQDDILLNEKLFSRIKVVYEGRDALSLTPEQRTLLEKTYHDFVRGGANLSADDKERLRKINEEIAVLSLKFSDNVLKETNDFRLVIDNKADLAGLPPTVIQAAAEAADEAGLKGKWVFTTQRPSITPFLQYSSKRDLRRQLFLAYVTRGDHGNESDNKANLVRIAKLRVEKAKLLGYSTFADLALEDSMARTPDGVLKLLEQVWTPALARAKEEAADLQELIRQEGGTFTLEPWDWWYYSERLRKARYDFDEEMLRPYFVLDRVLGGAFMVANKLWGITFTERTDIPVYHKEVKAYEVKNADGSHIGIFYVDYFPRASKRGGAWMSNYRDQCVSPSGPVAPVVVNVGNISRPTADAPSLLSIDEVETLFHEFGHGLHGLLSRCTYRSLSGTNVSRDFVELPSQIMENWATDPQVLRMYARHVTTNEPIPDELIAKMEKARHFNQGFITVEYMSAAYLDMDWHLLSEDRSIDATQFEAESMKRIGMIPEIVVRYRSPYFLHIFGDGYSAGYYSYIWSEVLDADAFEAFKQAGIFDQKTAASFRANILEKGRSEDPMVLYKRFRGAEPSVEPLLKGRGLK